MRYVLVPVAVLFYLGVLFTVAPLGVLVTWAVVAFLVALAVDGSRRGNRERALRRQIFLNESLIGYVESVDDERKRSSGS